MHVVVSPYDPQWSLQYNAIRASLIAIFDTYNGSKGDTPVRYTAIEHVGSTSIPEMPAKPVIDVDIVIPAALDLQAAIDALTGSGQYEFRGDLGIPERWAFRYVVSASDSTASAGDANSDQHGPARNVYVTIANCLHLRNHLAVRDLCRSNEQVRQRYADEKLNLSKLEWESVDAYCEAKSEVISRVLAQAGMSNEEITEIQQANR